jgi:hypothetical protein
VCYNVNKVNSSKKLKTKNMHFFANEDPEVVIPFVGVAVFSLLFLFTITLTGTNFAQLTQSFEPAESMFALAGEGMIAAWEGTEEVVYATAVYTGVIPFEESSYYAVALPFHTSRAPIPEPQVASAVSSTYVEPVVQLPEEVMHQLSTRHPLNIIYGWFKGK